MKLWQTSDNNLNEEVQAFTVGRDPGTDGSFVLWDCLGSLAHTEALRRTEILSEIEAESLKRELRAIMRLVITGEFLISPADEDCHTAIEKCLVEKLGDTGKKIHTGRSRNDQVLTAIKLFTKSKLLSILHEALSFGRATLAFAQAHPTPMPGFSHLRKAMPSSVALWASAYTEGMIENISQLFSVYTLTDSSPLGSASGFGTSISVDRELTARHLGFSRVQRNVLWVQNARGKTEFQVISVLSALLLDLNRLANDVILYSLPDLGYFELPEAFTTGSSIMPQKRNPDVLELVRAYAKKVSSLAFQVLHIASDLTSGYNRDMQLTKEPLIEAFSISEASLRILTALISQLQVNETKCLAGLTPEIFLTDQLYATVQSGVPFRNAYRQTKEDWGSETNAAGKFRKSPEEVALLLNARRSLGAPGNLCLEDYAKQVEEYSQSLERERNLLCQPLSQLCGVETDLKQHLQQVILKRQGSLQTPVEVRKLL